jgi:hypothetical protein
VNSVRKSQGNRKETQGEKEGKNRYQERSNTGANKDGETESSCIQKQEIVQSSSPCYLGKEGDLKPQPQGKPDSPDDNRVAVLAAGEDHSSHKS